jgi:small subunit ribosomal protein S6
MRRYETIAIINPDLSEEDRSSLLERIKDIITQQEGVLIDEDLWGNRKLAYEIRRKPRGYYARYDYCGMGPLVDELERSFRIDDRVLKYLTVQLEADADVEKIQAEIASARAAKNEVTAPESTETTGEDASPAAEASPERDADATETESEKAKAETAEEE